MTRNKNWNPLLYFLINCKSGNSAIQILCLKDEYDISSKFVMTCLCDSFTNFCFDIILLSVATPELLTPKGFLSKKYKSLKQDLPDIHHILDF